MKLGSPFCEIVNCAELKHEVFADEAHQYDAVYSVNLLSTHSSEPNMAVDYVLVKVDGDIVKGRRVGRPILHILHTGCDRRVGGATVRSQSVVAALRILSVCRDENLWTACAYSVGNSNVHYRGLLC